jgi:hypothetical protein
LVFGILILSLISRSRLSPVLMVLPMIYYAMVNKDLNESDRYYEVLVTVTRAVLYLVWFYWTYYNNRPLSQNFIVFLIIYTIDIQLIKKSKAKEFGTALVLILGMVTLWSMVYLMIAIKTKMIKLKI